MQCNRVNRRVDAVGGQQGRQRRGEAQCARDLGVVQRLDAKTIPGEDYAAGVALPDRKREHALEVVDAIRAPGGVGLEDDLGIAIRKEMVTKCTQPGPQVAEVVDTAVEHDAQAELVVDHRLLGVFAQIKDLQALVTNGQASGLKDTAAVRAAREEDTIHSCHGIDRRHTAVEADLAADTTHKQLLYLLKTIGSLNNARARFNFPGTTGTARGTARDDTRG